VSAPGELRVDDLRPACEGVVPPVLATSDAHGIPNVTYLSCAHVVDGERIALSNQFFSKTARNIMENCRTSSSPRPRATSWRIHAPRCC
jgi:hypothetical protein